MIVLNTIVEQKISEDTYCIVGNSFQYFDDDEEDKAKKLCDSANKYWKDKHLNSYVYARCTLKYINKEKNK